jgi:hypothetical protein
MTIASDDFWLLSEGNHLGRVMPKISEDAIVIGFLVAVPLWLFVGLPLLDLVSNMDQQQQQSVAVELAPWVNVLIGFLSGSVMSSLLGGLFT